MPSSNQPILECVPNFSEGRDPAIIEAIADAVRSVVGTHLLHIDASPAANRTVLTFAGAPDAVTEAAFQAIGKAAELIDMRAQGGVHPRIGATDVCPFVPLSGVTMEEAVRYSWQLGERVGRELGIPVYLYEHSAQAAHRRALPQIRKGQYEGFAQKMRQPDWTPDYGPTAFTPKSGATVIGARGLLVAFNISLNTDEVTLANGIAERLRSSGSIQDGVRMPGLLRKTRAIGWYMEDYRQAQVSLNLLDYLITSPLQAFEACKAAAADAGVTLAGSEVIGLLPESCLLEAGAFAMRTRSEAPVTNKSLLVHEAIQYLGLARLKAFPPREKILEWALADAGLINAE